MFDRMMFMIGEAMVALRRNGFMTFAAVSTVAVSLFLLGGMLYVVMLGDKAMRQAPNQLDVRVLLKEGVTYPQILATAKVIRAIPGVQTAVHIPRDKAWERFRKQWKPSLTEGVQNPLPDAFKVTVTDLEEIKPVVASLEKVPTVNKVRYESLAVDFLKKIMGVLRWLGTVLGGTLLVTAGVLIFNAIKMTILARRREVRIMSLVGASVWTISFPFLVEGLFQGVAGGTLAGFLLFAARNVFYNLVTHTFPQMQVSMPALPLANAVAVLGAVGGLYGLFCSSLALRMR